MNTRVLLALFTSIFLSLQLSACASTPGWASHASDLPFDSHADPVKASDYGYAEKRTGPDEWQVVFRVYAPADEIGVKKRMEIRARQLCHTRADVRLGDPSGDRLYITSDSSEPDQGREYHASVRCIRPLSHDSSAT